MENPYPLYLPSLRRNPFFAKRAKRACCPPHTPCPFSQSSPLQNANASLLRKTASVLFRTSHSLLAFSAKPEADQAHALPQTYRPFPSREGSLLASRAGNVVPPKHVRPVLPVLEAPAFPLTSRRPSFPSRLLLYVPAPALDDSACTGTGKNAPAAIFMAFTLFCRGEVAKNENGPLLRGAARLLRCSAGCRRCAPHPAPWSR